MEKRESVGTERKQAEMGRKVHGWAMVRTDPLKKKE